MKQGRNEGGRRTHIYANSLLCKTSLSISFCPSIAYSFVYLLYLPLSIRTLPPNPPAAFLSIIFFTHVYSTPSLFLSLSITSPTLFSSFFNFFHIHICNYVFPHIPSRSSYFYRRIPPLLLLPPPARRHHTPNFTHSTSHTQLHTLNITHPTSHTRHHTPDITHSTSHTQHHTPNFTHSTSHTQLHTLDITHPTLHTRHHTLNITHPTSHTQHHTPNFTHSTSHTRHYTLDITHSTSHTQHHTPNFTHSTSHTQHHTPANISHAYSPIQGITLEGGL